MCRILIVGGGSIGLLLAAKLAGAADARAELAVRTEEQAKLLQAEGIEQRESGSIRHARIRASVWTDEALSAAAWDWVLLCVKQADLAEPLLARLETWIGEATGIVCFQNGLGHEERMLGRFPRAGIWLAVTTEAALRTAAHAVHHTGIGSTIIGSLRQEGNGYENVTNAEKKLLKIMNDAGLSSCASKTIKGIVWQKLAANAVINPLTAIYRVRNGELTAHPERLELMRMLFDETALAAASAGYPLGEADWARILDICRRTAANESSMLQDVKKGRPTEIDYINGSIVREAARHGVKLPLHEAVLRIVKGIG